MRCALLLICAGIASVTFVADVSIALTFSLICIVLLLFALLLIELLLVELSKAANILRRLVIGLLLVSMGVVWHLNWASDLIGKRLPEILEGETLQVEGVVTGLPERSLIAQNFQFEILHAPSGFFPRKVILNYYGGATVIPGQYWRFAVRLNRPHGFSNPGGFDYEAWLFQRGISARGYVRDSLSNQLIADPSTTVGFPASVWLHSARYSLRIKLQRMLADSEYGGLLIALLLGDRSAISKDSWELFTATGSNHLFVISGLHIGMISGFAFWLALVGGRLARISRLVPAQKFAAFFALGAAFIYALLAGFSLPTQRAFIMIGVLICGLFWNARYQVSFRILLAVFVVLLLNPLALTSSGFWLSFIAVAALLAFAGSFQTRTSIDQIEVSFGERLKGTARLFVQPQLIVFVALGVPLIFFTQQLSLLAPVVNIIAIPVVGFLIVPVCFASLLVSFVHEPAAILLLAVADGTISLLIGFMEFLVAWGADSFQLQVARPNSWNVLALFFAVLLLLLPEAVCRRALVIPLMLCVLPIPERFKSSAGENKFLRVHVVDVGQGLAVIIQTRHHALLYDTGANLSPDFNIGSAVVVPALRSLGIHALDVVVVSHGDNDHAGGLLGIEPKLRIRKLISNRKDLSTKLPVQLCTHNKGWNWDGVEFRFLQSAVEHSSENNNSCVLQIRSKVGNVLLPGDIESQAEAQLARNYGRELTSEVLLAPHHGSRSSSSYALLKRVEPSFVVFSAGYHNSFGHPHEAVVTRYGEFASKTLNTADSGMISFEFSEKINEDGAQKDQSIHISQYRKQNSRYWH
ncbi:MAG: competence protein ComEC [Pseudohongiellaceae bacterium]|jgi:competence protein ComEC